MAQFVWVTASKSQLNWKIIILSQRSLSSRNANYFASLSGIRLGNESLETVSQRQITFERFLPPQVQRHWINSVRSYRISPTSRRWNTWSTALGSAFQLPKRISFFAHQYGFPAIRTITNDFTLRHVSRGFCFSQLLMSSPLTHVGPIFYPCWSKREVAFAKRLVTRANVWNNHNMELKKNSMHKIK